MQEPTQTTELDPATLVDEVIGNREGSTVRQPLAALAAQMAAQQLFPGNDFATAAEFQAADTGADAAGTVRRVGGVEFVKFEGAVSGEAGSIKDNWLPLQHATFADLFASPRTTLAAGDVQIAAGSTFRVVSADGDLTSAGGIEYQHVPDNGGTPEVGALDGLTFFAGRFQLPDARSDIGASVETAALTYEVVPSRKSYLVINVHTLQYEVLPRYIDDVSILVATITADATEITRVDVHSPQMPKDALTHYRNTLSSALGANSATVGLCGTSLNAGTGVAPFWDDILFANAQTEVTDNLKIAFSNISVGSSNAHYGVCLFGEATKAFGDSGLNDGALNMLVGDYTRFAAAPSGEARRSDYVTSPFDLLLVGYGGPNGGTFNTECVEQIALAARRAGSAVALLTSSPRSNNTDIYVENGEAARRIADAMGCMLIDTWARIREHQEQFDLGRVGFVDMFADGDQVHYSAPGQEVIAETVRAGLEPNIALEPAAQVQPKRTLFNVDAVSNQAERKNGAHRVLCFDPVRTSGPEVLLNQPGTGISDAANVALVVGGKPVTACVTEIPAGSWAEYSAPLWSGYDVIEDPSSAYVIDLTSNNGAQEIATGIERSAPQVNKFLTLENTQTNAATATFYRDDRVIRVECTSGTAKIVCLAFHTSFYEDLDVGSVVNFDGTWAEEPGIDNWPVTWFSDTDGDGFTFEAVFSRACLTLAATQSSTIVDIIVDGEIYEADLDLHTSGSSRLAHIDILPQALRGKYDPAPAKKYTVRVVSKTPNGSVLAPTSARRRFAVYGIRVGDDGV